MTSTTQRLIALIACTGLLAACGDGASPGKGTQVTFSIGTRGAPAAGPARLAPITDANGDQIDITSVKLVVRKVEFKREEDESCEGALNDGQHNDGQHKDSGENDGDDGHEDACESVTFGPLLVDLPLDVGATKAFSVALDPGTYDELKVQVHKPEPGNARDDEFLATNPGVDNSILAEGTYTPSGGTPVAFTYQSPLTAEHEIHLNPALVIDATNPNFDVTLKVDTGTWFLDGNGSLLDPSTANDGGANQGLVNDNIRKSFHAFRDDNHDCHDDDGSDHD
jgi:hypothetical protein